MKVGFIVECVTEGPETKVIPRLASLVNSIVESEVEALGSKPKVLSDCGRYAKALFDNAACDRVLVIWDARPYWDNDMQRNLTIPEQRAKASSSLQAKGLHTDPRVSMICIVEELEAWLLADGRGITHRINELLRTRPRLRSNIPDKRAVEQVSSPKSAMERIFRTSRVRSYDDWQDAGPISQALTTVSKLSRYSSVFPQFSAALS